jgi:filamentous hemagglutinin
VAVGTSGVSAMVSASRARGTSDGSDTTWSNTHLSADRAIELHSGGDTTLMGAVASAPKISADVGGDLTIASLQDTSHYQSQQRSLGGSAGVGITAGGVGVTGSISAGNSHINSDYASVAEQSALRAGNGGFDVNVAGNTTLAGGAITSTQAAVDTGANRFQTTNLTTSDIVNTASYDANAAAAAIGTSINFTGQYQAPGNSAGLGSDGGGVSSTTQAAISGIAGNKDARTGDVESTITPIFDAERVQQEINAQVQITQAFAHEAYVTVDKYVSERRGRLRDNIRHTDNEDERANLQTQLDDLALQERVINVLIGAVTGSAGVAATNEAFSAAADGMRQTSIENSMRFKGIIDNAGNVISNVSGESEGLKGDWIKLGGTRVDLDALCGTDNSRCVKDNDQLALKDGYVQFTGLPDNPMTLTQYLDTPEGQKMLGATGGLQGAKGTIFGYEYAPGSMMDRIVEAFAGTHDFIGGQLSNLYDEQGNAKRGRSSTEAFLYDRWSEAAIPLAAPFAMSEALPQPVWQAISVLLKNTR